jgi:hypothetical protein
MNNSFFIRFQLQDSAYSQGKSSKMVIEPSHPWIIAAFNSDLKLNCKTMQKVGRKKD